MATYRVTEAEDIGRFELRVDGQLVGFARYHRDDNIVVVPYVETLPEHRGQGFAAELLEGLLSIVREQGRAIAPVCPFAVSHIEDNPQHHDLLATSGEHRS